MKHHPLRQRGPPPQKKEQNDNTDEKKNQNDDANIQIDGTSTSTDMNNTQNEGTVSSEIKKDQVIVQVEDDQKNDQHHSSTTPVIIDSRNQK